MSSISVPPELTEEETSFLLVSMRAVYAMLHIEYVAFAIQFAWCMLGLSRFNATKSTKNNRRRPYLAASFIILTLFAISSATDSIILASLTFNMTTSSSTNPWYGTLGTVCNALVALLGDGVLIYRCYFIWPNHRWVVVAPSIPLLASLAMSILAFTANATPNSDPTPSYHKFFSAWIALSVAANLISTGLIAGKLLWERRRLSTALQGSHLTKYTTATAILIESAFPLALAGVISFVVLIQNTDPTLVAVFPGIWFCLSGLCPQLIIFRVAMGTSYPVDLQVHEKVSQPIYFARPRSITEEISASTISLDSPHL